MAGGYGDLLRTPARGPAARPAPCWGGCPNAMAALAVVLFLRSQGGRLRARGHAVRALRRRRRRRPAAARPARGPARPAAGDDRRRPALRPGFALLALTGPRPLPLAVAAVVLAGARHPAAGGRAARAVARSCCGREDRVQTAYAMDAAAQEVMFAVGPLLVTLAVCGRLRRPPRSSCTGRAGRRRDPGRGHRAARPASGAPRSARRTGWARCAPPGLAVLLGSFFFVGIALGSIAVAAVAYGDAHGGGPVAATCWPPSAPARWSAASAYGARQLAGPPERRLRVLSAGLARLLPAAAARARPPWMMPLAALSGLFLAPVLACGFLVVDRHAPAGTVTEAFSWLVTAVGVGAALGTAAAGPAAQHGGAPPDSPSRARRERVAMLVLLARGRFLTVAKPAEAGRKMIETVPPNPVSAPRIGRNVQSWTAAFSGWRTSTASHARSGDSGVCPLTRWRGTSSAVSCHGAAAATSSCATVPASTSTWARTRSTPLPSATT